jgi:hypothetical protein
MLPAGKTLATISLVTALTFAVGGGVASAAPIGGITTAKLTALTMAASTGAPTVVAWGNFNDANGTNLNGTFTDGGAKTSSVTPAAPDDPANWRAVEIELSLVIDASASSRTVPPRSSATVRPRSTSPDDQPQRGRHRSSSRPVTNTANGRWSCGSSAAVHDRGQRHQQPIRRHRHRACVDHVDAVASGALTAHQRRASGHLHADRGRADAFKNATQPARGPYQWLSNGLRFDDFTWTTVSTASEPRCSILFDTDSVVALASGRTVRRPGALSWRGESMKPMYQQGDLLYARKSGDYKVGDIAIYRIPDGQPGEGTLVVHRIRRILPNGTYLFQGDNKNDTDDVTPDRAHLVGKPIVDVGAIPTRGLILLPVILTLLRGCGDVRAGPMARCPPATARSPRPRR